MNARRYSMTKHQMTYVRKRDIWKEAHAIAECSLGDIEEDM
jgi:hypothetical protein